MPQKSPDKMSEIDDHIMKRFDIKKRLGKGAYGIVWKAIDKKTGETVAVKKIFDAFRNQTDSQRTFREIMFLQSFRNHPNIIQLHSIHRAINNRDIYLGFEYMDIDLHMVIKRHNVLRDCHRRYIMYQLFNATRYIHSGNVIHRDQKPSNVLLDQNCRCKIADFGLARSIVGNGNASGDVSDTDPALTDYVATRWYRAPEILVASKRYTKGIDMWSLGCILAEMLAQKPIFPGSSTVNQVEKIMASIPTPSSEDINSVCTGIGFSMIKNATANVKKVPLESLLGKACPDDALDLVKKLLIFNPNKRLTAEQALEHEFVAPYREPKTELVMEKNVIPPLNDDVRLSIDDYRNKLYELMSRQKTSKSQKSQMKKISHKSVAKHPMESREPEVIKVRSCPTTIKGAQSKILPCRKEVQNNLYSQAKFHYNDPNPKFFKNCAFKSESRLPITTFKNNIIFQSNMPQPTKAHRNSIGDVPITKSRLLTTMATSEKEQLKRKTLNLKSNFFCDAPFNSYNQKHGIITASALRELKSAIP